MSRLPFKVMTGEQSKLFATSLAGLTSPLLWLGLSRIALPANATADQVTAFAALLAAALASWGNFLVVVFTVLIGGKPDKRAPTDGIPRATVAAVLHSTTADSPEQFMRELDEETRR